MILIFSISRQEPTTEEVIDWLDALGVPWFRLNGEDVLGNAPLSLRSSGAGCHFELEGDGFRLPLEKVRAAWYRRWIHRPHYEEALAADAGSRRSFKARIDIARHLSLELKRLSDFLFSRLRGVPWLTTPELAAVNKLQVLESAVQVGLSIPATLVTTSRQDLEAFARQHGRIITKSLSDSPIFFGNDETHLLLTAEVGPAEIAELPAEIFPSLFQERLDKEYELRIFYLAGEIYPMAIFSQADEQTRADFRNYNPARPNRTVPYRLPADLAEKVDALMRLLGLETGSLDMVRTPGGRYVFLEVNPVGQFGMVSGPCNYHLEERVATLLARKGGS